jgi:peptidoglycan hydrolase CwlO-like protein
VVAVVALVTSVATATSAFGASSLDAKIAAAQKAANAAAARYSAAERELGKAQADVAKFRAQAAANQKKIDEVESRDCARSRCASTRRASTPASP